jgi:hypothetical protein
MACPSPEQVRNTAEVRRFERTALRLGPEPLHDQVEQVRPVQVQEIEDLRILQAFDLKLRIRPGVWCDEGWRRDAEHVLREPFFVHQFGTRHAHQLDADAHEPDIVDVGRHVGTGSGKTDPRLERLRFREDAVAKLRGQVVAHGELAANDPLRLRVPAPLEPSGLPQQAHLLFEARDDRLQVFLFVRDRPFLGDRESLVGPLHVDQRRREPRQGVAEQRVERRPDERIEAALDPDHERQEVAQLVEEDRAGIGSRCWPARVRIHGVRTS